MTNFAGNKRVYTFIQHIRVLALEADLEEIEISVNLKLSNFCQITLKYWGLSDNQVIEAIKAKKKDKCTKLSNPKIFCVSQKNSSQQETCNEHSFSLSTLLFSRVVQEIAVSMNGDNILALQFRVSSRFEFQAGHFNACYQNYQKIAKL